MTKLMEKPFWNPQVLNNDTFPCCVRSDGAVCQSAGGRVGDLRRGAGRLRHV